MPPKYIKRHAGFLSVQEARSYHRFRINLANLRSLYNIITQKNQNFSTEFISKDEVDKKIKETTKSIADLERQFAEKYNDRVWNGKMKNNLYYKETGEFGCLEEIPSQS
jgi:hypothetical protein